MSSRESEPDKTWMDGHCDNCGAVLDHSLDAPADIATPLDRREACSRACQAQLAYARGIQNAKAKETTDA